MTAQAATQTQTQEFTIGASVRLVEHKDYQGECGVVSAYVKGWYEVDLNDTEDEVIVKVRAKQLELWVEPIEETKTMSGTLNKYRKNYLTTHTAKGNKSQSSKESVAARYFEGYDHCAVAHMVASLLNLPAFDELYHQYAHLNNGQMRMNSGNKLNNAIKRGELIEEDVADLMEEVKSGNYELPNTDKLDRMHRPHVIKD